MPPAPDLARYRRFVVAFSGGKDSLAALLHLLDCGGPNRAFGDPAAQHIKTSFPKGKICL